MYALSILSLLGASVYMLSPENKDSAQAGLSSKLDFLLDSSKLYHKYLLFLYPIPLQLCPL